MKRPIFLYITIIIQTIFAVWAPFFWRRSTFAQRCIIILLIEMCLSSIIELWMGMKGIQNLWVMHCSTLLEFIIIMILFYEWRKSRKEKRLVLILGFAFTVLWCVAKCTFESMDHMDVYTANIAQIIYIILAVSLLFNILKETQILLKNDTRVWIASGLIVYSAGTLFVVSLFNVIVKSMPQMFIAVWYINWILVILVTLFYARGILCRAT